MDRITVRIGKRTYLGEHAPLDCKYPSATFCRYAKKCKHIKDRSCQVLYGADRLAEYEDVGLTPEEIVKLQKEKAEREKMKCENCKHTYINNLLHRYCVNRNAMGFNMSVKSTDYCSYFEEKSGDSDA